MPDMNDRDKAAFEAAYAQWVQSAGESFHDFTGDCTWSFEYGYQAGVAHARQQDAGNQVFKTTIADMAKKIGDMDKRAQQDAALLERCVLRMRSLQALSFAPSVDTMTEQLIADIKARKGGV